MEQVFIQSFKTEMTNIDVLQTHQFYVEFPSELNIDNQLIQAITLPKVEKIEKNEITWGNVVIKFIETSNKPTVTEGIMSWIKKRNNTGRTIKIIQLDNNFNSLMGWTLSNCKVVSVDFGKCDYSNKGLQEILLTVNPEDCDLFKALKKKKN